MRTDDAVLEAAPLRKVFEIGLGRTGTTSLTRALQILGYRSVHLPSDPRTRAELSVFLRARTDTLRLSLPATVDALADTPVAGTCRALDHGSRGSAFVLTIRDVESWLASCEACWESILRRLYAEDADARFVRPVSRADRFEAGAFTAACRRHRRDVRTYFLARPVDCLALYICGGEGRPGLCGFLGVDVPAVGFPHIQGGQ